MPQTAKLAIPAWMWKDREYAAALHIFVHALPRALDYVEPSGIDFPRLVADSESWSSGERMLVTSALNLFNRTRLGDVAGPGNLCHTLDDQNLRTVMEAMEILRGWKAVAS